MGNPSPNRPASTDLGAHRHSDSQIGSNVVGALERYLEVIEAGGRPTLDELPEGFSEDSAAQLAECLEGLKAIHHPSDLNLGVVPSKLSTTNGARQNETGDSASPKRLGDYRIIREIGRGGMGIVFEAWQESVQRPVALKILPQIAAIDHRNLDRFRIEVQAAARVQHPHIVPIYFFGTDAGIPYYAMQFIEGFSLADWIWFWQRVPSHKTSDSLALRQEDPQVRLVKADESTLQDHELDEGAAGTQRLIARLGVQAARALEHSHAMGVLHRDIKPSNLLVEANGHLWISDFGLARIDGEDTVTRQGDLVGTVRYMSPEQARGHRDTIDSRSDVYSLGATLYEALTRSPLFPSGEQLPELILRITHEAPKLPRSIDPTIDPDLEQIILKAIAKSPDERYQGAGELADDLDRFLKGEPVLARPKRRPPFFSTRRWKHSRFLIGIAALILAAIFAQSTTLIMLARENHRAQIEVEAIRSARREHFRFAEQLYQRIADTVDIGSDPVMASTHLGILREALDAFNQFVDEASDDPELRDDCAMAIRRAGDIQFRLGLHSASRFSFRRLLALIQSDDPLSELDRDGIHLEAHAHRVLGNIAFIMSEPQNADRHYKRAVQILDKRCQRSDRLTLHRALIQAHLDRGRFLLYCRSRKGAQDAHRHALECIVHLERRVLSPGDDPEALNELEAIRLTTLGQLRYAEKRESEASEAFKDAIELFDDLVEVSPSNSDFRRSRQGAIFSYACFLATCTDRLIRDSGIAAEQVAELCRDNPVDLNLAVRAGTFLMNVGEFDRAESIYRAAMVFAVDRADLTNNLAWLLSIHPSPGHRKPEEAVALAQQAVRDEPQFWIYWNTLGVACYRAGRFEEAQAALERSTTLNQGGHAFDYFFLAMVHAKLGDDQAASKHFGQAVQWMETCGATRNRELLKIQDEALEVLENPKFWFQV